MDFVNDDGENACPLCMEEMDLTDRQLKPCKCGYEICVWCWHHVMEVAEKDNTEGRCPACRTPYDKEKIVGMTFSCERLMDTSSEKRQKSQKSKTKASEMRKHLSNVRVIQRNLVYIIGIPSNLADEEILERREFFGQYGKVLKVSISKSSASNQHSSSNPTSSVYITYTKEEEAMRCIQVVNGYILDGRPLKACFGTTKYCHAWLKNMPCNNPDCLYLHDIGTQEDSFTKEEMVSTCASKIPQFHGPTNPLQRRGGSCLPPPEPDVCNTNMASSSKSSVKTAVSNVGVQAKTAVANGSTGKATALPAAASWGLRVAQGKTLPTKAPIIPVSTKLKLSSSHTLSVSPPSNPPTSAAVVAAAATPLLHSDSIQPSLVVVSSNGSQTTQCLPCSVTSKQNMKNHQTRTNMTNGVAADTSAVTSTTEKHIREDSPERRSNGSRLQQNQGFHEVLERASDISFQNSAFTGSSHPQNFGTEKLGCASVSSDLMTRRPCHDGSVNFNHNFEDLSISALDENSSAFHSTFSASKLSPDASTVSANLLCIDCNSLDEKSMVESIREVCISDIEDQCTSTEPEEQHPGSVSQMFSETGRQLKHGFSSDASRTAFYSWKSTATSEVCCAKTAISKDDMSSVVLPLETSNLDILHSNIFKNGKVDGKSDFSKPRSEGSILTPLFQDSSFTEDRTIKANVPAGEQLSEGFTTSAKSQYLERHENDRTHIRHHSGNDSGEDKIISNILSLNFDWEDDSITSPHDVVTKALLGEKDKVGAFPKDLSSSRKLQNNGQSRFSFARHDGSSGESSHSLKSLISSGQLPDTWSKGKDSLDDRNGYDQVNRPLNDRTAFDQEEHQMLCNRTAPPPLSGSAVVPPPVSRSQFSAPPGFSVPTRAPQVPPPGFFPQSRVERPYEPSTPTVFSDGMKDHNETVLSQNAFPNSYTSLNQTVGGNSSNDVEFIDPAIMAVGKGKFPIGQIQRGSAGPDSVFSGPRQDLSDSSFGQSFLGLRSPFLQQVSSTDYDVRLQMLKQKPFYTNSSLTSRRQQFTFQDQIGDISSYLSRQNDAVIPSMMREQSQMNIDSVFTQPSFQQPMNLSFRSSSVGANGWDSWNRMSSALETGFGERTFLEIGNKERLGSWDPKSGLTKPFPTYGESMFHMPCSENYYSRPFEM